jgi:hypothetical protein
MNNIEANRFQDLFTEHQYLSLKNYLYNVVADGMCLPFKSNIFKWINLFYVGFVWLDAKIMPRTLSTVLLIQSAVSDEKIKKSRNFYHDVA